MRISMALAAWIGIPFVDEGTYAQQPSASEPPLLRRIERVRGSASALEGAPLRSADGSRIGTWQATPEGTRLQLGARGEVVGPRLQRWLASSDARTLVGMGDPRASEHPFELTFVVLRDGQRVARAEEPLSPESEATVGADGSVAIVGHAPGERGQAFVLVLRPDGEGLYRHELPRGLFARDPVLFGSVLLFRVHRLFDEGRGGAILRADVDGVRTLLESPGALALAGFPESERALIRSRDAVTWIDADGRVLWQRAGCVRPAGPNAWVLWRSASRDVLGVVVAGLRRRGEPEPPAALVLFDAFDGTELGSVGLEAAGPPSEVDLCALSQRLVVDWNGQQEVFTWNR